MPLAQQEEEADSIEQFILRAKKYPDRNTSPTHNGLLYFHTEIKNQSNVPFDVDYITWKIVDKKVAKRTAVQGTSIPAIMLGP